MAVLVVLLLSIADGNARLAVAYDIGHLIVGQRRVDRSGYAPCRHDAELGDGPLGSVVTHDGHTVTDLMIQRNETLGHFASSSPVLGPGHGKPLIVSSTAVNSLFIW